MTIEEAIKTVDDFKPNQYEHETKVKWLSNLDGMIFRELICTHAGHHGRCFDGYDGAPPNRELLVPFPYADDVYNYWLQAQIDKENGEMTKYNQSVALYNNAYRQYASWYNRTHMPLPANTRFAF